MKLLKGKKIADGILNWLKKKIKSQGIKPGLAVVLVGKNKASEIYVNLKRRAAKKVGIAFFLFRFGKKAEESEIMKKIKELNKNPKISGIIVQLPLPEKFNAQKIINAINIKKDADGFHPRNLKLFLRGKGNINPVFPTAIIKILETIPKVQPSEILRLNLRRSAIIIANSEMFGEVMRKGLKKKKISAEYILAEEIKIPLMSPFIKGEKHYLFIKGRDGEGFLQKIKSADIIISAVGKPRIIKGEMIKKGAIVIDGGITKRGKKVLGDVDYRSVKNIAGCLSPVPGGVGPVTIACLLKNVYLLAKKKI